MGIFWGAWTERDPQGYAQSVAELLAFYEAGKIRPRISQRFPLEKGAAAIAALAGRKAMGKIVVVVDPSA